MAGIIFLAPLLTFLLPSVRAIRRPTPTLSPSDVPVYFFTSHHKTGCALMNHLCDHVQRTIDGGQGLCARCAVMLGTSAEGTRCVRYWSDGIKKQRFVEFYNTSTRFFAGTDLFQVVRAGGNYRATHVVRDPLTTFASSYIYDQKGDDHQGAGKAELQGLSLKDGLKLKALDVKVLTQQVLEAHRLAVERPGTILEVRMEDFQSDYDAAAAKIFRFAAGPGREGLVPAFLARAAADDQNRWHKGQFVQPHVSAPEYERRVVAALRELCAEGNEAVAAALAPREELGYGEKCPGPVLEAP